LQYSPKNLLKNHEENQQFVGSDRSDNMKAQTEKPKQPLKYWLVDITLTSGEVLHFYVKALNLHEAYQKADGYAEWTSNGQLLNHLRTFKLMV